MPKRALAPKTLAEAVERIRTLEARLRQEEADLLPASFRMVTKAGIYQAKVDLADYFLAMLGRHQVGVEELRTWVEKP